MHPSDFFFQLLLILVAARIFGELASRLKVPSVIGELLAGVLLGPSLLGLLAPSETLTLVAEVGILLLLFEVGLETDIAMLARTGIASLMVATTGLVAPFALGFAIGYWLFHLPLLTSLFLGGTLTATSIGITVRVLADLGRRHSAEARIVLGAAVLDDVLGVVLLAVLQGFASHGQVSVSGTARVLVFVAAFMVTAPTLGSVLSTLVERLEKRTVLSGLLPTSMVSLILLSAWSAHRVGAPELLGGFAAGIAVSHYFRLPFALFLQSAEDFVHRVNEQMKPIVYLFTPIFFVMVGLSLNLREVNWASPFVWTLSVSLLGVAFAGKIVAGFTVRGVCSEARWAIGLAMVPRGEVGLIFAELGRTSGVLDQQVYAAVLIVIALTTLLPPFLLRWYYAGPGKVLSGLQT